MEDEVLDRSKEAEISNGEEEAAACGSSVDVSAKSSDFPMSGAEEDGDHDNSSAEIEDQMEEQNLNLSKEAEVSNSKEEEEEAACSNVIDVSAKSFDLPMSGVEEDGSSVESLFLYKNSFNLIPSVVGSLKKLKTLKFFGNELNLFPEELNKLADLECLQVKACVGPELGGLEIAKMESLKDLELSRAPFKLSETPVLTEIAQLKELKKLSLCHFDIRHLPSEIGCLTNLVCLNLSFNKLKNLPVEITKLSSLVFLDVSYNKLVQLPSGMCGLERLEELDVSNNRMTSLGCLELELESMSNLKRLDLQNNRIRNAVNLKIPSGICCNSEGNLEGNELSPEPEKKGNPRGSRRRPLLKRKVQNNTEDFQNPDSSIPETDETESTLKKKNDNVVDVDDDDDDDKNMNGADVVAVNVVDDDNDNVVLSTKRRCDSEERNEEPKARKVEKQTDISLKYSRVSCCEIDDYLLDGFYDAGRDRPFMSLTDYQQKIPYDSVREVILVDRTKDENLDAIAARAQAFVSRFSMAMNETEIASLLAIFVSDHFGGSDKSGEIQRMRKDAFGSNYVKPFVCTCTTGNDVSTKRTMPEEEDISFSYICGRAIQCAKERRNSIVVPIGNIQFGVCRHRAILMKYLCDRMKPKIQCELVRGFLDFTPHAWNVIVLEKTGVRMIVDACRPQDIREETDSEYFSRYIPLTRMMRSSDNHTVSDDTVLVSGETIGCTASNVVLECQIGEVTAAAKVRTLKVSDTTSQGDIRAFELGSLGEVRMLSLLRHHPCIVKYYGHQMSSNWEEESNVRDLKSTIFMEYIQGGSLDGYLKELKRNGEKRVPLPLALFIARDVSHALVELHDRHIIHRDIKSENILIIDLDENKNKDGAPLVKLSDFDKATSLRASLHSCCIGHIGGPPPNVCVGTPRWMAPEVFQARNERTSYGLEADIWSFGCLLFELLTLQIPYSGLTESDILAHLESGMRPELTEDQEMMGLEGSEKESEQLKFLVSMYRWCTETSPQDRPTADKLHKLLENASSISSLNSLEQDL